MGKLWAKRWIIPMVVPVTVRATRWSMTSFLCWPTGIRWSGALAAKVFANPQFIDDGWFFVKLGGIRGEGATPTGDMPLS